MAWWNPVHVSLKVIMCVIANFFLMSIPRVSVKYHFGIILSHIQRMRYGQEAQIYFGYKSIVSVLASFGLVVMWINMQYIYIYI